MIVWFGTWGCAVSLSRARCCCCCTAAAASPHTSTRAMTTGWRIPRRIGTNWQKSQSGTA